MAADFVLVNTQCTQYNPAMEKALGVYKDSIQLAFP